MHVSSTGRSFVYKWVRNAMYASSSSLPFSPQMEVFLKMETVTFARTSRTSASQPSATVLISFSSAFQLILMFTSDLYFICKLSLCLYFHRLKFLQQLFGQRLGQVGHAGFVPANNTKPPIKPAAFVMPGRQALPGLRQVKQRGKSVVDRAALCVPAHKALQLLQGVRQAVRFRLCAGVNHDSAHAATSRSIIAAHPPSRQAASPGRAAAPPPSASAVTAQSAPRPQPSRAKLAQTLQMRARWGRIQVMKFFVWPFRCCSTGAAVFVWGIVVLLFSSAARRGRAARLFCVPATLGHRAAA
nr:MAG TPA: hypothetical protein [Caudoviricetes sp.]